MNLLTSFGLARSSYYSKTLMHIRTRIFTMAHEHKHYFPLYVPLDKKAFADGPFDEFIDLSSWTYAPTWKDGYKALDKIFSDIKIDKIVLLFSPFNAQLGFGNEKQIKNKYDETIKNPLYAYNFISQLNILHRILFYYHLNVNLDIPITQIVVDPLEPDWTKFNPKNHRFMFYESEKLNTKFIPSMHWNMYNSATKGTIKVFDFVFGMTSIMTTVDLRHQIAGELLDMQKVFDNHGLKYRIYLKDKARNIDNLALEGKYDERIAASKYTLLIPSYAVEEFSTGRFLEALDKSCIPLMHEQVQYKTAMNDMPNIMKIYKKNGLIIKTQDIIPTIERLNYQDIIEQIQNTPEFKRIYDENFYKDFLKKQGNKIFLTTKLNDSKTHKIMKFILSKVDETEYRKSVINIFKHTYKSFENPEFIFDLNEHRLFHNDFRTALIYNPFMLSKYRQLEKRKKLMQIFEKHYEKVKQQFGDEMLYSTGNGVIDDNCIMVLGMAPGFYNGNEVDLISKKFKPSFYFGNTSQVLRYGFKQNLQEMYFTNLSKIALSKEKTVSVGYKELYNISQECFKKELAIINPRMIIALGKDVEQFLNENKEYLKIPEGTMIYRLPHPSAMLIKMKNNYLECINKYSKLLKYILQKESAWLEKKENISWI